MLLPTSLLTLLLFAVTFVRGKPFKGQMVDESNLKDMLTENERMFLFGDPKKDLKFSIANFKHQRRRKRSTDAEEITIEAKSLHKKFDLKLQQSPNLLDPDFLLVRRWANRSESISGISAQDEISGCFYRTDKAAFSLCGDVRGIITSEDSDFFVVHPLPERFASGGDGGLPHLIVQRSPSSRGDQDDSADVCSAGATHHNLASADNGTIENKWSKHRRKATLADSLHAYDNQNGNTFAFPAGGAKSRDQQTETANSTKGGTLIRRKRSPLPAIFVETAVFVDRDLYKHMSVNYPKNTERELVRFVLAMINAVQILYHDPSLGRQVNFILKRLEILHEDPVNLKRPHDIDRFLSNFCAWQRLENPQGDNDPLHWDHALILTGLDLYVVSKHGKVSSQVVGLAPVAGMCTITSSCTVNEGRHFESVYVVAHEIGHNLGMRHDGPLAENKCDPSSYVMSPTLGSGKITWSSCSRRYLQAFLDTSQSRCLLDHSSSAGQLDHSAEGILPGERFDADQQCMLKYGRGSKHSPQQPMDDVCRDLHCQRDRYTWTSHPALEGTNCGDESWCRSGRCTLRSLSNAIAPSASLQVAPSAPAPAPVRATAWGRWGPWADCASGCLYGADGRLGAGSTGIMLASRRCSWHRPDNGNKPCDGHDTKYQACSTPQCLNVPRMTVSEFTDQICARAREVDADLIGTGIQRLSSGAEDGCAVWCHTRGGGYKSRGWTFPDGTVCSTSDGKQPMYCIDGKCEEFGCPDNQDSEFSLRVSDCEWESRQESTAATSSAPWRRATGSGSPPTAAHWHGASSTDTWRGVAGNKGDPTASWRAASGCHYHCIAPGSGLRLVDSLVGRSKQSIQLCRPDDIGCTQMKSPYQHATYVCSKYKDRVRRLSGLGMQISPALEDPDRPCRIACQDESVTHRFYLVNGQEGWFPFGTACSKNKQAYCISGKCLPMQSRMDIGKKSPIGRAVTLLNSLPEDVEIFSCSLNQDFGPDDTPLEETEFTLPLLSRNNSSLSARIRSMRINNRHKRSLEKTRIKVTAKLDQDKLDEIISTLNFTGKVQTRLEDYPNFDYEPNYVPLDFNNPIHVAPEETIYGRTGRHYMFWNA